jgi:hypothetical protein
MQNDLQKRILANVLLSTRPEHVLRPATPRISMSSLVSLAFSFTAVIGLILLMLSKLPVWP